MKYPGTIPTANGGTRVTNRWTNFWMIHAWIYKLNPTGLFANTHPDVSTGPRDNNGGPFAFEGCISARAMPEWFKLTYITGDSVARVTCNVPAKQERLPMNSGSISNYTPISLLTLLSVSILALL